MEYWLAPLKMECNLAGGSMNDEYQVSYSQRTMKGFLKISYIGLPSNNLKSSLGKIDYKYMKSHSRAEHESTSSPSTEQEEIGFYFYGEKYGKMPEPIF